MSTERPLDEIMSERDAPEGGAPPPMEDDRSSPDQPRDERGRWAPKTATEDGGGEPPAAQPPAAPEPPPGYVPIQAMDARLAKSEERLQAVIQQNQQMLQALQGYAPKPPPAVAPDFFDNPDAAFEYRIQRALEPVQQRLQAQLEQTSSTIAMEKYGKEAVLEAYAALAQRVQALGPSDPVYARVMRSPHPYGELIGWHQEQSALQRYGSDPEAFIKAEVERRLAEAQGQTGNRGPAPPMPATFTGATPSVGPRSASSYGGPRPLSEIMGR
jgi:hypothetical protein